MVEKKEILEAIRRAERRTSGEIRVHVRSRCRGDVFEAAKKTFLRLGMHRTRHRNAVLIFVALGSRKFAILGDSGIHCKVDENFWKSTRECMALCFKEGKIEEGILAGIRSAGDKLAEHFPREKDGPNELPDEMTKD